MKGQEITSYGRNAGKNPAPRFSIQMSEVQTMSDAAGPGPNELNITKPVSVWKKEIELDGRSVLTGLGKMGLKGASLDWSGVGEAAFDILGSSGLAKAPGEVGFLLVYRSFISAITKLGAEYADLFGKNLDDTLFDKVSREFEADFEKIEITINYDFFNRPGEAAWLRELKTLLSQWLSGLGMSSDNTGIVSSRLREFFVFELNNIWREKPEEYASLKDFFDSPFIKASEEERGWQLYKQEIIKQVHDRMFAEPFGVSEVYIPLRAYFKKKEDKDPEKIESKSSAEERIVFDLDTDFQHWVNHFSRQTAIRVVNGGPGSGKSTFAKIFAAWVVRNTDIPLVYVPLHLFNIKDDLYEAMAAFIRGNSYLSGNPLDPQHGKKRLLIIFDGLDELAFQGKTAQDVANAFVDEVLRKIDHNNSQECEHQVVITGRPIAIETVAHKLRREKQVLHVLPYLVDHEFEEFKDPGGLLETDQRQEWWKNYGRLPQKKNYKKLPKALSRDTLTDITAQPLLNYLVALTFESDQVRFTDDTTLNEIYEGLIKEVYQRRYENERVTVGELDEDQFIRVLEEIALAMWHGGERRASMKSIMAKCEKGGVGKHLKAFSDGARSGVTKLLTAFYFRPSGREDDGDQAFEFTHKSFGEYLTARRLSRFFEVLLDEVSRHDDDSDRGWSIRTALEKWGELFQVTAMDHDLLRFIRNEFHKFDKTALARHQETVARMLAHAINQGFPIRSIIPDAGYYETLTLVKNSEEALLAVHSSVANLTKSVSNLTLKNSSCFRKWLSLHRAQVENSSGSFSFGFMGYLGLQGHNFTLMNLYQANFSNSDLNKAEIKGAYLPFSNFTSAQINDVSFNNTDFFGANFAMANLIRTDLEGANLIRTNLNGARLNRANLTSAKLINAKLNGVDLTAAKLTNANLTGAKLTGAKLTNALLAGAKLEMVDLKGADLINANLTTADLREVKLTNANLTWANLTEADLTGADLTGADLKGANLEGAIMPDGTIYKEE